MSVQNSDAKERILRCIRGEENDSIPSIGGWINGVRNVAELAGCGIREYMADPIGGVVKANLALGVDGMIMPAVPKDLDEIVSGSAAPESDHAGVEPEALLEAAERIPDSSHYETMKRKGYLVRTERGVRTQLICCGNELFFDATHPGAQKYVWEQAKRNYHQYGIRVFWLDEAEPEYDGYDFDNIRYHIGTNLETGNIYPMLYAKAFYDGLTDSGVTGVINLSRCAWAGSQRYGAAVWSGDIQSNFAALRKQVCAGLNVGLSGIPWWTSDIGGFFGGDPEDEGFCELLIRWFQYGTFCPLFRLHGYRLPTGQGDGGDTGNFDFDTCGPNEVYSFGEEAYGILKEYLHMRERLRPYIMEQMRIAHETGTPPMRPLFYDFPGDAHAWGVEDAFLFGPDILVAPILYAGARSRQVYLPAGAKWRDAHTGRIYEGGQYMNCEAPLSAMPLFLRDGADLPVIE